jgi:hypothetical protein
MFWQVLTDINNSYSPFIFLILSVFDMYLWEWQKSLPRQTPLWRHLPVPDSNLVVKKSTYNAWSLTEIHWYIVQALRQREPENERTNQQTRL